VAVVAAATAITFFQLELVEQAVVAMLVLQLVQTEIMVRQTLAAVAVLQQEQTQVLYFLVAQVALA
jgi:hypothetical protein